MQYPERENPVRKVTCRQRRECILDGIVNLVIDNNLPMALCERILAGTQTSPVFSASIVREALRVKAGLAREATTWTLSTVDDISLTMDHWTSCTGDTYSGRFTFNSSIVIFH